ncbi:MAG: hypothetical protein ACYDB2_06140 [Acidimicrobiales bacterium]
MSDVSNGPGWWQASDGKWYPAEQRPDAQASAPQPPADYTSRATNASSSKSSFAFDMKKWHQTERVTAIATLVLLISLFLPWFTYNFGLGSVSVDGLWHGWMYLVFILCLVILVYLVTKASYAEMPFHIPMAEHQLLLYATAINFVLTLLAFVFKPGGIGFSGIGWGFGAFVGLAASVVAAVPLGLPALRERRR